MQRKTDHEMTINTTNNTKNKLKARKSKKKENKHHHRQSDIQLSPTITFTYEPFKSTSTCTSHPHPHRLEGVKSNHTIYISSHTQHSFSSYHTQHHKTKKKKKKHAYDLRVIHHHYEQPPVFGAARAKTISPRQYNMNKLKIIDADLLDDTELSDSQNGSLRKPELNLRSYSYSCQSASTGAGTKF